MIRALLIVIFLSLPVAGKAQDRLVRLHAPQKLIDSGLMQHILPRFSLKTQVRVELVPKDAAQIVLGTDGQALFDGLETQWHMAVLDPDHAGVQRLTGWLASDVGRRTITGFAPDGVALFSPPGPQVQKVTTVDISGDAAAGHRISRATCGRCHAVDAAGRKTAIGSSPSFFVLRSLPDWQDRFAAFYVLKPHGAFTQVAEVTEPFPPDRPSPIVPIEITLDDLEAMLAYVAALAPADLGKPLQHQ